MRKTFQTVSRSGVLRSSQQVEVDGIMLGGGKANPPVMVGGRRRTPYVGHVRTLRDRRERS